MPQPCSVAENTIDTNQSSFWDSSDIHWDAHRIGWAVAGGCTILVRFICCSFLAHFFKSSFTDDADIIGYHPTTLQVLLKLMMMGSEMLCF